jgi:ubiquinone/menaquinone biosynthesis C-methylase UbiE
MELQDRMQMDIDLAELYKKRFDGPALARKNAIWRVLCDQFFQKYIPEDSAVLDIGAGFCEFINNIKCAKKYAVDLSSNISDFAKSDVKVFNSSSTDLSFLTDNSVDMVFMSNFLEHLRKKEEVVKTLLEAFRVLRPGGRIMIMQPNIRYLHDRYWDFFDHYIPLSDKSLVEVLQTTGFQIEWVLPRFLPYTTKSSIFQKPFLVWLYLKMPFIWLVLGKQMFVLGEKHA